ncbi:MAG: hypothetical protein FD126_1629 [Elusimicrobia bacterium]|nr:MAG: hypothetical protein FD126_1629 [Elusimicrobiota bacterium]
MALLLALLVAGPLLAAEPVTLVFPSGGELKGVLLQDDGAVYVLERDGGQLEFPTASVARVRREPNAEADFRAREAKLPLKDPAALWELARFAAENGLPGRARRAAERVVALAPDHAEARAHLGYERVFGQWVRGDELMRAKGLVRHEGAWVTLAQRKSFLAEEARAQEEAARRPPPPQTDGLAAAINGLTAQLASPRSSVTQVVLNDGGASALAQARRARFRSGRVEGDEQGARPWRPEPFRVGSVTQGSGF